MESTFSFLEHRFYHNSLHDWLIALLIVTSSILFARVIYWLIARVFVLFSRFTGTKIDNLIIQRVDTPIAMGIVVIGIRSALKFLEFPRLVEGYVHRGFVMMSALVFTWLITRIVRVIIEQQYKQHADRESVKVDEQMLLLIKRTSLIIIWSMGAVVGLNNAGIDVSALIAGLGIGGLAFALAAQETVKNLIGGLVIFFDKPFHMGDVIQVKEFQGTVIYIGMRSTRIRNGAGRIITIPNAQFTDSGIENITNEPSRRIVTYLSLIYETPPAKIQEAMTILQTIVDQSRDVNGVETYIFLEKFSASSLDINFTYFIRKGSDIHQTQTDINLAILQKFAQAGIEIAYPTQTSITKNISAPSLQA